MRKYKQWRGAVPKSLQKLPKYELRKRAEKNCTEKARPGELNMQCKRFVNSTKSVKNFNQNAECGVHLNLKMPPDAILIRQQSLKRTHYQKQHGNQFKERNNFWYIAWTVEHIETNIFAYLLARCGVTYRTFESRWEIEQWLQKNQQARKTLKTYAKIGNNCSTAGTDEQ